MSILHRVTVESTTIIVEADNKTLARKHVADKIKVERLTHAEVRKAVTDGTVIEVAAAAGSQS